MKMEWSGLTLGRMTYSKDCYTVGMQKTDIGVELGTPPGNISATIRFDTAILSLDDAEAFNDWLNENKGRTFKVTLELDEEDEEVEE